VTWQEADVADLPFSDASFDVVACQFALMFFPDRVRALQEMSRVLAPGGRLVAATWASLDASPGYGAWVALVERELGVDAAAGLRSPFVLGDTGELRKLFEDAGLDGFQVETIDGWARFESIEQWVEVDVRGWILSDAVDDAVLDHLKALARIELAEFVDDEGRPAFRAPAHIMLATRD
jgi:SAM-dependent methyltransferase